MEAYRLDVTKLYEQLGSGERGLETAEAEARLAQHGYNEIIGQKKTTALELFIEQFKNFLVLILVAATAISFAVGEIVDAAAILVILLLNAFLGFYQERKAENALEALKKVAAPRAKVLRSGETALIAARELVPGDVILLEAGDKVPADCRIIAEMNLKANQSVLTGESLPAEKSAAVPKKALPVAEQYNMLFSGTAVVYGNCTALVVSTGMSTEFGKIASVLQERDDKTPLQLSLEKLGKQLGIIIVAITAVVFIAGSLHGIPLVEIFLTSVALAVAAIPEGLPAIVTITLALGLLRMSRKNAIIRKLSAAETLGSTTVICSDKTGTLTVNQMTVKRLYADDEVIDVTGEGFSTTGTFLRSDKEVMSNDITLLLTTGMYCNNAHLESGIGDPTELALLVSAKKSSIEDMRQKNKKTEEFSFDSQRKMMSVVYESGHKRTLYAKGAVEEILRHCSFIRRNGAKERLTEQDRKAIMDANHTFASSALRVLGFAVKELKPGERAAEKELTFAGMQAMIDPPRPEAKAAIAACRSAGIRVVMITGDHRDTAVAIAGELGLLDGKVMTGEELDKTSDREFGLIVEDINVYARVSPQHKVRITETLKKRGHVVAMTGDGINDAPALKKADIGIAMGITGTDVTKEASDMVLTDDNFASIVAAVEEGRGIYDNVKKFVYYLLSCNLSEIAVIFFAILFIKEPATGAFVLPLLPLHLLWINLVTDGLPALALGVEPKEPDIMKRKPRDRSELILSRSSLSLVLLAATIITVGTLFVFVSELGSGAEKARTIAFTTMVLFELFAALSFRSVHPLSAIGFLTNRKLLLALLSSLLLQLAVVYLPALNTVFGTMPLSGADWVKMLFVSSSIFFVLEARKLVLEKPVFRR